MTMPGDDAVPGAAAASGDAAAGSAAVGSEPAAADAAPHPSRWTVVVLTGGRSRRMGRDKATLAVGGRTLLELTLQRVPPQVAVVVAGPHVPLGRGGVTFVQEDPPGGGPVAGLDAALAHVRTSAMVLLATDLPLVGDVPSQLVSELVAAPDAVDAVLLAAADGRAQQLCAAYRVDALRRAIASLPTVTDAAMRDVVAVLRATSTSLSTSDSAATADDPTADAVPTADPTWDIDTPEDAERLAELLARHDPRHEPEES